MCLDKDLSFVRNLSAGARPGLSDRACMVPVVGSGEEYTSINGLLRVWTSAQIVPGWTGLRSGCTAAAVGTTGQRRWRRIHVMDLPAGTTRGVLAAP